MKRRLAELVDPAGALVLNADDPVVAAYAGLGTRAGGPLPARAADARRPRRRRRLDRGRGVERLPLAGGGRRRTGPGGRIMPVAELRSSGPAQRLQRAGRDRASALLFGVAPDAIRGPRSARSPGVEHRLEPVGEVDGVRFVNDSQGTQPDAVIAALRAFAAPIVLIAGGRDKGVDLAALAPVVAERAAAAVLIGESGPSSSACSAPPASRRTERAATLEAAVGRADAIAREIRAGLAEPTGDPTASTATVLLSPAAASFDMFVDYAARGRAFKAAVAALAVGRGAAAEPDGGIDERRTSLLNATVRGRADRAAAQHARSTLRRETPPARLRDPRGGRRARRDRHPDGLFVVGHEGLRRAATTRSRSSGRRSCWARPRAWSRWS